MSTPPVRDQYGRYISTKTETSPPSLVSVTSFKKASQKADIPPMVDLKVTNPVTYLKLWWKKIMYGEGISIRIHPLTAILIALAITGGSFYLGKYLQLRSDLIERFLPQLAATTSVDAGFTGVLYMSESKYFLSQASSQAINIKPSLSGLSNFIGKTVFVAGKFDPLIRTLTPNNISLHQVPQ